MTCRVYGRVQGVWFRGSTQRQALRLGLRGHARNLPDGSVEVLACGPTPELQTLRQWLQRGPPSARVERVECELSQPGPTATEKLSPRFETR